MQILLENTVPYVLLSHHMSKQIILDVKIFLALKTHFKSKIIKLFEGVTTCAQVKGTIANKTLMRCILCDILTPYVLPDLLTCTSNCSQSNSSI